MRRTKIIAVMLLLAFLVGALTACSEDTGVGFLDEIPELDTSKEVSKDDSVEDPAPAEGQTAMPKVTQCYNVSQMDVLIAGTCETDAIVSAYAVGAGTDKVEVMANGENYAIIVNVGEGSEVNVRLSATAEGKTVSEERIVIAGYNASEAGNAVYPTMLFNKAVLFLEKTLTVSGASAIRTNTALADFVKTVNSYVNTIETKKYDTEIIYVMIPSKYSIYPGLADGYVGDGNAVTLYSQTKEALEGSNATVIDLTDALKGAAGDYPLYYNTYSAWSEYAAFIGYTEVMNYIAQKYPAAAPRPITDFDIKEVDALAGDLAYYIGLDSEQFGEKFYDFVPKFDTNIGDATVLEDSESYKIADILQYIDAENSNYLPCNAYFAGKEVVPVTNTRADEQFHFFTDRADLPTALIYRDDYSIPMVDMLAERFNNSAFMTSGVFNVNVGRGLNYASEGKENVDYILVFVSEENLTKLVAE